MQEREQKRQYETSGNILRDGLAWTYTLLGGDKKQLATYNGVQGEFCGQNAVWMWPVEHNSYGPAQTRIITRPNGFKEFVIPDHLGSSRLTISAEGDVLQRSDYEPFGSSLANEGVGSRTSYIGREEDGESGLGFYGVRLYEPEYGRFTSVDPLWQEYPTQNSYHYVANSPISMFDYTGFGVEEVNQLFSQIKSGADALFAKAMNVMVSSGGSSYTEYGATIVGNPQSGYSLQNEVTGRERSVTTQITNDGTWESGLLPGLAGDIHTHCIPKTQDETELFDNIPPGGKDIFSVGSLATKFGNQAEGFVSFVMAGSTNFAVEITDAAKAAMFFSEKGEQKLKDLFAGLETPAQVREAIVSLSKLDTGVTVYESGSGEVKFQEVK